MHQRIATIMAEDLPVYVGAITSTDAELIEVRLDGLWHQPPGDEAADQLMEMLEAAGTKPLLATLRPKRQGGKYDGPEDVRISLLIAAARAGFAHVDLESDQLEMAKIMAVVLPEAPVILSNHRMSDAPSRDRGLRILQEMQDLHSSTQKLAIGCGSFVDQLRCLELAYGHAARQGEPAIAPLSGGAPLRAALALAGNQATYGHAKGAAPAISGQPAMAEVEAVWQHWGLSPDEVGGRKGWYAVLGDPVDHSLSPRIHNAMLRKHGLPQRYGSYRVPDSIGAVRLLATVAPRIGLRGASVTSPLKQHFAKATDGDAAVRATGAANCIRWDATPVSTNTDATAFLRLLAGATKVAVLGAGGAARGAVWAAQQVGAQVVAISRPGPNAELLAADLGVEVIDWEHRDAVRADVWVQATTISGPSPLAKAALKNCKLAIELVYSHGETGFETQARAAGAKVVGGREFLIEQALDAYKFWTGQGADKQIMEAALAGPA